MTNAPATRTRRLTAWQLWQMLPTHAAGLQVEPLMSNYWHDKPNRLMARAQTGWRLDNAAVEVWYDDRRVWAMVDYKRLGIELSFGPGYPFCYVEVVGDGEMLVITG